MRNTILIITLLISIAGYTQQKTDSLKKDYPKDSLLLKSGKTLDLFFGLDTLKTQSFGVSAALNYLPFASSDPFVNNGNQGLAPLFLTYRIDDHLSFNYFSHAAILNSNENQATDSYYSASPFTELFYTNGSKNQHHFFVFHTQNFRRYLNLGFKYSVWNSDGMAYRQTNNHRNFRWFLHFNNPKVKWKSNMDVFYNKLSLMENGGLVSNESFENHTESVTANYAVNLIDSDLSYRSLKVRLLNKYELFKKTDSLNRKKSLNVFESTLFTRNNSVFSSGLIDNQYYANSFLDTLKTHDSTACTSFRNDVGIFSNGGFFGFLNIKLAYSLLYENLYQVSEKTLNSQLLIFEVSTPEFRKNQFSLNFEEAQSGWRKGNYLMNLKYAHLISSKSNLTAGFLSKKQLPEYFFMYLNTNHLYLNSQLEQEQISKAWVKYNYRNKYSSINEASVSITGINITNPTILKENGIPVSYKTEVNGFIASGLLEFEKKGWGVKPQIWIQKYTNSEIVSLPLFVSKLSLWKEFDIAHKAARARFGIDGFWFSEYYSPGYMPSAGLYYNQSTNKTGNYPYLDAYFSLQFKKARVFFKTEHLNEGLMGYNYLAMNGYPMQGRSFRFGVSWIMLN